MSSRYFATDVDIEDYTPPRADISVVKSTDGRLRASLEISDESGLRALVIRRRRPNSSDVVEGRSLSGKEESIDMPITIPIDAETMDVRFAVTDVGGNVTEVIIPPKDFVLQQ